MDGSVSFFELGVADADKARTFYGQLFGWTFADEKSGARIETPNVPGGLHGDDAGASPYLFFSVSDLAAALEQVRVLGGTVGDNLGGDDGDDADPGATVEASDTAATFGRFVLCTDDQGSHFGLHQPPS